MPIDLTATPLHIASNGITLLAIEPDGVALVDSLGSGHPISLRPLGSGPASAPVILLNGDYAFVIAPIDCTTSPGCNIPLTLVIVNGTSGNMTPQAVLNMPTPSPLSLAVIDDKLLVAWTEGGRGRVALLDRNANVLVPPAMVGNGDAAFAGSDGRQFLVAIGGRSNLQAYRISATGQLLDATGVQLSAAQTENVRFARGSIGVAAAWDERKTNYDDAHAVTRAAADFDALLGAPTHVLTMAPPPEEWPRLPRRGNLAVWRENGSIVAQMIGGAPARLRSFVVASPPAVAGSAGEYLVVWSIYSNPGFTIEAMRVDLRGIPIDAQPLVIDHTLQYPVTLPSPAVDSDGTNFLVVWPDDAGLRGTRISADGTLLDATPITVVVPQSPSNMMAMRVVWTGEEYVVGSLEQVDYGLLISPVPPAPALLRFVRVTATGSVLDKKPPVVWRSGPADSIGLTVAGNSVAAVWNGAADLSFGAQRCIWGARLYADLTVAVAPQRLECDAGYPLPFTAVDLAWNDSELVGVWADQRNRVAMAQRFTLSFTSLDARPFAVSPAGAIAGEPSIIATPNGTTIAYVRVADELPYAGVPRAFIRTLARMQPPTHKHAARR